MNIIIFIRSQLQKYSTTVFLLILAVTDLVLLWISLVPDTTYGITGRRIEDEFLVICELRYWLLFTSGSYD
jgi:hypothetical protein